MKSKLLLLIMFLWFSYSYCQPGAIELQFGSFKEYCKDPTIDEFRKMASQSIILLDSFPGFKQNNLSNAQYLNSTNSDVRPAFTLYFCPNPITGWRMGLSYTQGTSWAYGVSKKNMTHRDTLTPSQTGLSSIVLKDSVTYYSMTANYVTKQIRFDCSYILREIVKARTLFGGHIPFFIGAGVSMGVSADSHIEIHYVEEKYIENRRYNGNIYGYSEYEALSYNDISERFRNKNSYSISFYVPMGFGGHLGKNDFWSRTYLYYEFKVGENIKSIPGIKINSNAYTQHSISLKYDIN